MSRRPCKYTQAEIRRATTVAKAQSMAVRVADDGIEILPMPVPTESKKAEKGAGLIYFIRALTLDEVAGRLHCTPKTLATWLRENPQEPPLFAKPGRDYIISETDFSRIYEAMKCRSNSRAIRPVVPIGISGAQSKAKLFTRLRELTTGKAPKPSASSAKPPSSNVASLAQARQSRS